MPSGTSKRHVIPYTWILLLFSLMWWQRKVSIDPGLVTAPDPKAGIEGACDWTSIKQSYSGTLQATLVIYRVPSQLRIAYVQSRLLRSSSYLSRREFRLEVVSGGISKLPRQQHRVHVPSYSSCPLHSHRISENYEPNQEK